jgi:hypothetical protein
MQRRDEPLERITLDDRVGRGDQLLRMLRHQRPDLRSAAAVHIGESRRDAAVGLPEMVELARDAPVRRSAIVSPAADADITAVAGRSRCSPRIRGPSGRIWPLVDERAADRGPPKSRPSRRPRRRVSVVAVTSTTAIGRHTAWRDADLMRMTFDGPLSRSDAQGMRAMMEQAAYEGTRCYFVADMSGCTGIDAEARKYMAEWSRTGGNQLSGVAAYGINFALRTIVSLTLAAIKFLGHPQTDVVFVKDEAEALKWVAAQRLAARSK